MQHRRRFSPLNEHENFKNSFSLRLTLAKEQDENETRNRVQSRCLVSVHRPSSHLARHHTRRRSSSSQRIKIHFKSVENSMKPD